MNTSEISLFFRANSEPKKWRQVKIQNYPSKEIQFSTTQQWYEGTATNTELTVGISDALRGVLRDAFGPSA